MGTGMTPENTERMRVFTITITAPAASMQIRFGGLTRDHGARLTLQSAAQRPRPRERRQHTITETAARCRVMKVRVRIGAPHPNRQRQFDIGSLAMGLLGRRKG